VTPPQIAPGRLRQCAPWGVLVILMVAYVAIFGTLSLRRHQNLRTNALDLGYTDQAVWNTLHGRPFRFSTYLDAAFKLDIPIQEFKEPDVLLGYHVEPILAAIAPLYLIHDGPETLLWLQTIVIALGAIPVYLIARRRFGLRTLSEARAPANDSQALGEPSALARHASRWLPIPFVLLYLLAPALEAANLSDFHAVALSPTLLLFAFYYLEINRSWGFVAFAVLAAICKEEIGLTVAMMGMWAMVAQRRLSDRWWVGLGAVLGGGGWFLLCAQVIMPHFSGLTGSAFLVRYGHLGDSLRGLARNLVQDPGLFASWLRRPDVLRYLRDLFLAGGGMSILHPLTLAIALPAVAINAFSAYDWMRSGGGHYSASIVPFLIIAAVYGVDWLAARIDRLARRGRPVYVVVCLVLTGLGLAVGLVNHYHNGVSPLSRRFSLEPLSEHARRARPLIEKVNSLAPDIAISVGSNLYPHVAHRQHVYLFPTVSDAQVILLDVTGPSSPIGAGEQSVIARELLEYAQFGVVAADHGFLLLERNLDQYRIAPEFDDVFYAEQAEPQVLVEADFGGLVRLEGFDWDVRPVVRPERVVEITTYWQALVSVEEEYRIVFYFWDDEHRLVRIEPETQTAQWLPTWLWPPGRIVKVTLPPLPVGDLGRGSRLGAGLALLPPGYGPPEAEGRLVPIASATGERLLLSDQDTILELVMP
jgi:uncharacterized membrane protein